MSVSSDAKEILRVLVEVLTPIELSKVKRGLKGSPEVREYLDFCILRKRPKPTGGVRVTEEEFAYIRFACNLILPSQSDPD